MKFILSILGIFVAGAIFFLYTKPTYDTVQGVQAQISEYNQALDKAQQLQELKQTLLTKYNSFSPTDLARLQTMLPTQVNNIGLILDLDTLANTDGMSLENVNVTAPDNTSNTIGSQTATAGSSTASVNSLSVAFTVHGTYAQFEQFMTGLQQSLEIVDLSKLSITTNGGTPATPGGTVPSTSRYTFDVTLTTYSLQ